MECVIMINNWKEQNGVASSNFKNIQYTHKKQPISRVKSNKNWKKPLGPPFQGYGARVFQKVRIKPEGQTALTTKHPLSHSIYQRTQFSPITISEDIITICAVCEKVKNPRTGKWERKTIPLYSSISHGYCTSCLAKERIKLKRYRNKDDNDK